MREILFRGKSKYTGAWVYGAYSKYDFDDRKQGTCEKHSIVDYNDECLWCEVSPETVGQYTGLTDKNGKKIFEGDIVLGLLLHSLPVKSVVSFQDGSFGLLWDRAGAETFCAFTSLCNVEYEVIGNIHENQDLFVDSVKNL